MKNIRWIITLMLLVGYGSAFGQQTQTKASIMKKSYGAIRAKMVKDACKILEYDDKEVIDLITDTDILSFDKKLQANMNSGQRNKEWYLHYIIGDANDKIGAFGGDQLNIYDEQITNFRNQLRTAYTKYDKSYSLDSLWKDNPDKLQKKKRDIGQNDSDYMTLITDLKKQCECYLNCERNNDFSEYKTKYPDGKFISLVKNPSQSGGTGSGTSGGRNVSDVTPVQSSKDQETIDWESCTTFENCIQYLENYPNGKHRSEVVEKAWEMLTDKKQNHTKQDFQDYLSVLNDNDKHKVDVKKKITEFERADFLKECKNADDYETALKNWGEDSDFRDEVYDKFWIYCENKYELDSYLRYKDAVDKFGGSKHYKEAKDRIKELQTPNGGGGEGSRGNGNAGTGGNDGNNDTKDGNGLWYIVVAVVVAALLLGFILRKRKKTPSQQTNATTTPTPTTTQKPNPTPAPTTTPKPIPNTTTTPKPTPNPTPTPVPTPTPKPTPAPTPKQGEWVVVGASVKGNGHIESNMPCQDNNKFEILGKGWGVAVVSDGAGSAAHSELGSKVVVERGVFHFKNLVEKEGWMEKNTLPSDAEWLQKSYFVLKTIRNEVEMVAKKNNVELKSLSATCLAVVFSPMGLLAVHVGDGRMGCKTASGGWKAIMTPHKGDEANQTLFLISEFWDIPNYVQSGVLVPESIVVREPVEAFAVMSDGCESTAWLCTAQNAETGKYYDQNKPFEGFFNPLEETLASFHKDNVPEEERKEKWYKFIESGTKGFVKEQDDKTMILGVLL